jgi:methyltransferase-like protein 6
MKNECNDEEVVIVDDNQLSAALSLDDRRKLACPPIINDFQRANLEKNAKKNWDLFYKRHGDRFFKKRYWTRREFNELFCSSQSDNRPRYLLELGCGCGDFVLPLLDNEPEKADSNSILDVSLASDIFIYCCDISEKAIEILKSNDIYRKFELSRIHAFVGNLLDRNGLASHLAGHTMDFVSLIFVLSALDPAKMKDAIDNISAIMSHGGLVFFRDYAIYDKAMLRFSEKSKISDQFYVRQDGTRAYFFTKSEVIDLFAQANFECETIEYIKRETINNATNETLSRIFIQAKFKKRSS